jgi:hypothetical protein
VVDSFGFALDCDVSDDVGAVGELGSRRVRVGKRARRLGNASEGAPSKVG